MPDADSGIEVDAAANKRHGPVFFDVMLAPARAEFGDLLALIGAQPCLNWNALTSAPQWSKRIAPGPMPCTWLAGCSVPHDAQDLATNGSP